MAWPVRKVAFPPESRLHSRVGGAWFHDAWQTDLRDVSLTPVEIAERVVAATPGWAEALIRLRNAMVAPFRVRPVERLGVVRRPAGGWKSGDRFGMFTVETLDETELVMGIDDRHLDVRISFLARRGGTRPSYVVSSLVETHNLFGRVYMLPVSVVHPILVIGMMRAVPM